MIKLQDYPNQNLIKLNQHCDTTNQFNFFPKGHLDNFDDYQTLIDSQSPDWYYRNNTVTYTINDQNYRCDNFNNVDWSNSIIMLGCSFVYGIGVDDQYTLPSRLSKLTNLPIVNLGATGCSQQFCLYNLTILRQANIKPKAVVIAWPHSKRTFVLKNSRQLHGGHFNNWFLDPRFPYEKVFAEIETHRINYIFNRTTANLMYHDIPVIHTSFYKDDVEDQLTLNNDITLLPVVDKARDLKHPGMETFKNSAAVVYRKLLAPPKRIELLFPGS